MLRVLSNFNILTGLVFLVIGLNDANDLFDYLVLVLLGNCIWFNWTTIQMIKNTSIKYNAIVTRGALTLVFALIVIVNGFLKSVQVDVLENSSNLILFISVFQVLFGICILLQVIISWKNMKGTSANSG